MARILVIEDNADLREMMRLALFRYGHEIIEACNGKEGLELFAHTAVDLVITDIVMPERDGFEVLMALRMKHPPVKVIAISGGGRGRAVDYLEAAKRMGAAKVLEKPIPREVLMAAINELLPVSCGHEIQPCGAGLR